MVPLRSTGADSGLVDGEKNKGYYARQEHRFKKKRLLKVSPTTYLVSTPLDPTPPENPFSAGWGREDRGVGAQNNEPPCLGGSKVANQSLGFHMLSLKTVCQVPTLSGLVKQYGMGALHFMQFSGFRKGLNQEIDPLGYAPPPPCTSTGLSKHRTPSDRRFPVFFLTALFAVKNVPPPPLAQARPCLSTKTPCDRCFDGFF